MMHTTATKTTPHTNDSHAGAEPSAPVVNASPTKLPMWAQTGLPLQTRLTINQPGDAYEQEADRVAEQVMRMPDAQLQRKTCSCSKPARPDGMCAECKKKELGVQRLESGNVPQTTAPPIVHQVLQQPGRPLDSPTRKFMEARFGQNFSQVRVHTGKQAALSITPLTSHQAQRECAECEEEEGILQRKESGSTEAPATAPPIARQTLNSPGQPLDATTRAYFEPRFGRSFADVRLHTGEEADIAACEISARAFTVGNRIAFAAGQYKPHSETGRRLLAHELTHVVQQERIGQSGERMLLQRKPIEGDKACIEPPPIDIATVDLPSLECVSDLRGASVWTMRLWNFERDKDTLSPCHEVALDLLISDVNDAVASNPDILGWSVTSIVGHASPEGEENYNENLALRRAEAVFSALGAVVNEALPAPISSGERCGEGAPPANYPYFRAVDVTIEFSGESLQPPYLVPGRGNQVAQPKILEGMTSRASQFFVRAAPAGKKIGRLALQEMHVQITDKQQIGKDIWFKVVFSSADFTTISQEYPKYIQELQAKLQNRESLSDEEQQDLQTHPQQQAQPSSSTDTWIGEDAFGYAAMRYDTILELIDAFDKQYEDQPFRDRLTRLRQIGENVDLPGDFIVGHGGDMPDRVVRDDRAVDPSNWSLLLEAKQVIMPNSEIIDLHHFIFGIDALASLPEQQKADTIMTLYGAGGHARYPDWGPDWLRPDPGWDPSGPIPDLIPRYHSGESYSNATWSGDVGGAVGDYVAHASEEWEAANPTATKAQMIKMYFDTRAPEQDLLADVDAWGVYKNVPKTAQEPSAFDTLRDLIVAQYGEGTPSEESAIEYERQVASGRGAGISEFLCHYGFGTPNNLNSQSSAVANVEKEVRLFGEVWYLRNAGFSSEQLSLDATTSQNLDDASKEMTKIFLEWLENLAKQQEVSSLYCESPSSTLPKGSE